MPEFIVEMYELHAQKYSITADTKEEAIKNVNDGEGTCLDNSLEYIQPAFCYSGANMPQGIRSITEE